MSSDNETSGMMDEIVNFVKTALTISDPPTEEAIEEKADVAIEEPAVADEGGWAPALHHCPHLVHSLMAAELHRNVFPDISGFPECSVDGCGINKHGNTWVCLGCRKIFCGRYANKHMLLHFEAKPEHCMGLGIGDLSFWCFECDSYIHHLAIREIFELYKEAHLAKFHEPIPGHLQRKVMFDKPKRPDTALDTLAEEEEEEDETKQEEAALSEEAKLWEGLYGSEDGTVKLMNSDSMAAFISHPDTLKHRKPNDLSYWPHVEQPKRVSSIRSAIKKQGLLDACKMDILAKEATEDEIELVHTREHTTKILGNIADDILTSDTFMNEFSARAAKLAIGGLMDGMDRVMKGELNTAFAVLRPPGHHCEKEQPMGFCLFNNVVVAIENIRKQYKECRKVLIVDWDVHHGNGTEHLFWDDSEVLYFSIHRYDHGQFYPGTGAPKNIGGEKAQGFNVNVGLLSGMGDNEYKYCWKEVLLPIAKSFKPDIIVVSAGFDACIDDPLGGMNVTPPCYGELTALLLQQVCDKMVVLLEGGYNLETMPAAACCVMYALIHKQFDESEFMKAIADPQAFSQWETHLNRQQTKDRKAHLEKCSEMTSEEKLGYFEMEKVSKHCPKLKDETVRHVVPFWPVLKQE